MNLSKFLLSLDVYIIIISYPLITSIKFPRVFVDIVFILEPDIVVDSWASNMEFIHMTNT